ncbi:hypothetical protein C8R45DRAFT_1039695 [Mycena sanguinolenta]|nr:hypothetical protein C8R45DRAFT_1039695 [Mycena sanguinolenta]
MFALLRSRRQRYNPPPGPPPVSYAPPAGPPPSSLGPSPPVYKPAGGDSHEVSERNATQDDFEIADNFCRKHPRIFPAKVFPEDHRDFGPAKWGLIQRQDPLADVSMQPGMTSILVDMDEPSSRSRGPKHRLVLERRNVATLTAHFKNRGDACLTSNLPIIAGNYISAAKRGVYFEITVRHLAEHATIALGMQCLPYPPNRLPGWHRQSAALHFDDHRIYFDDSEGGTDYMRHVYDPNSGKPIRRHNVPAIKPNDTIGCGYEFPVNGGVGSLFYTYNGERLPVAFPGIFDPKPNREEVDVDVFAAVGVTDGPCQFDINFGVERFKWSGSGQLHDGNWNSDEWSVNGLFRHFGDGPPEYEEST